MTITIDETNEGIEATKHIPTDNLLLQPIPEFHLFTVDERPGEQWIRLKKKFGETEEIKVDVTMFDVSIPKKKPGGVVTEDDVQLRVTMIVNICKGEGVDVLEFVCSAWPDTIEIRKVYARGQKQITSPPYMGPEFKYVIVLLCFLKSS